MLYQMAKGGCAPIYKPYVAPTGSLYLTVETAADSLRGATIPDHIREAPTWQKERSFRNAEIVGRNQSCDP